MEKSDRMEITMFSMPRWNIIRLELKYVIYVIYNVNLIVWWFFFSTSQEICFCWIDFMALLIYIHVLYVLAIWQKINGKDWGLKKNCYSLNDPDKIYKMLWFKYMYMYSSSILSQEYIYIINGFITTELSNWVH